LGLIGCQKATVADPGVAVACTVTPEPPRVGIALIVVRLTDRAAKPVTGAHLKLEGDMSHPGMEPVFAKAIETNPGNYAAHLQLTMPGDWVIVVQATLPDGRNIERQVDLKGVLPG
jgi:hypothetical protein